jgi:hypothetical protein
MLSMVERLARWGRRTGLPGTGAAEDGLAPQDREPATNEPIFRLRRWPSLPPTMHTAAVLRLLSVMSTRPVNRGWMLRHSGLQAEQIDKLLERLQRNAALEVIDPSGFGPLPARH